MSPTIDHFAENKTDSKEQERAFKARVAATEAKMRSYGLVHGDMMGDFDSGQNITKLPIMDDYQDLRRPANAPRYTNAA